jgi:hypothetical protein
MRCGRVGTDRALRQGWHTRHKRVAAWAMHGAPAQCWRGVTRRLTERIVLMMSRMAAFWPCANAVGCTAVLACAARQILGFSRRSLMRRAAALAAACAGLHAWDWLPPQCKGAADIAVLMIVIWGGRCVCRARAMRAHRQLCCQVGELRRAQVAGRRRGAAVVDEHDDGEVRGVGGRKGQDLLEAVRKQVAAGPVVELRRAQRLLKQPHTHACVSSQGRPRMTEGAAQVAWCAACMRGAQATAERRLLKGAAACQ